MMISTPNWFAAVMGTGIVATATVTLPWRPPGLHTAATAVWALAAALLVALSVAALRHPREFFANRDDPVMAHFFGAPPMAMMTVGAGALLLGRDVLGDTVALAIAATLWTAGTLTGLASAVAVPYLQFTRHTVGDASAFGGWLIPVVPPMVSAATGALLVPYAPPGQARLTLLLACWAMFGISLVASLILIGAIWQRLARHKVGAAAAVPTLWIVLGPLGQSITAANALGDATGQVLPAPYAPVAAAFGVLYGVPLWGFALLWAGLAISVTVRAARDHLPFSLTWWSFTFPVGTCVTATSALAAHTGATVLAVLAVLFHLGLVAAWVTVAGRTVHMTRSTAKVRRTKTSRTLTTAL
ncbi:MULTISPECIES: TDT family transporter [Actinoplanes]|uniref:TDT family transporter n=1 Tax=Actinoplanes TaxID=1865 RepID=UPI0005F2834A|nr:MULTISPECIES: TDT family transporter [Actinoplanes]GLY08704.1 C4-dicarboxylate ABC transporter [Actinoplanes sp. NBRC 101535]